VDFFLSLLSNHPAVDHRIGMNARYVHSRVYSSDCRLTVVGFNFLTPHRLTVARSRAPGACGGRHGQTSRARVLFTSPTDRSEVPNHYLYPRQAGISKQDDIGHKIPYCERYTQDDSHGEVGTRINTIQIVVVPGGNAGTVVVSTR